MGVLIHGDGLGTGVVIARHRNAFRHCDLRDLAARPAAAAGLDARAHPSARVVGTAYLIGAFSGTIWWFGDLIGPALPAGIANVLLFITVGMIWSAARLFHGRRVRWGVMFAGAA